MKLTNISLAVLVALGLVACGGSDDNKNQTTDPKPPKEIPGDGGNGGAGDDSKTQANEKSGINPERVAPDLTVPADLVSDVKARKEIYLDRGFSDHALGYPNSGTNYLKNEGTDPADIKHLSMYNFADEEDLIPVSLTTTLFPSGEGAIYVGENPTQGRINNAFAKGKDGKYYRVKTKVGPAVYDKDTKFYLVDAAANTDTEQREKDSGIEAVTHQAGATNVSPVSQSEIVFIANAGKPKDVTDETYDILTLGKSGYDLARNQVVLNSIQVLGKNYVAGSTGQSLDLNGMDVKREIQIVPVTSTYTITNGKETAQSTDDYTITKDINLGNIKAYNLPYSIAFVTIDPSKEHEKDIFDTGNYVVDGLQTVSLPKDGRAFYYGKSFNASVEGDIKLTADFFEDRAGVVGTVTNRKNIVTDKKLPNLRLGRLELTDPSTHGTGAKSDLGGTAKNPGRVTGDPSVNSWSVQFYGLEAQEAAGAIYHDTKKYREVYNTQRKELSNRSNDSSVK